MFMMPKRFLKPIAHSKLSSSDHAKYPCERHKGRHKGREQAQCQHMTQSPQPMYVLHDDHSEYHMVCGMT